MSGAPFASTNGKSGGGGSSSSGAGASIFGSQANVGASHGKAPSVDMVAVLALSNIAKIDYSLHGLKPVINLLNNILKLGMNQREIDVANKYPFHAPIVANNTYTASREARKQFPDKEDARLKRDAFRHVLWSALNNLTIGPEMTELFLSAHEDYPGNPLGERRMDEYNNQVGFEISLQFNNFNFPRDYSRLVRLCREAVMSGRTINDPGK